MPHIVTMLVALTVTRLQFIGLQLFGLDCCFFPKRLDSRDQSLLVPSGRSPGSHSGLGNSPRPVLAAALNMLQKRLLTLPNTGSDPTRQQNAHRM